MTGPMLPPAWLSPTMPVSGDRAQTEQRLTPETAAPVVTPGAMVTTFSGPSGSAPASVSSSKK